MILTDRMVNNEDILIIVIYCPVPLSPFFPIHYLPMNANNGWNIASSPRILLPVVLENPSA